MRGYKGGGKAGRVTEGGAWAVRGIWGGGGGMLRGLMLRGLGCPGRGAADVGH